MISEDLIMRHLNSRLGGSDAGDVVHHLDVLCARRSAVGPLGVVPDDAVEAAVYAIAPDESVDVMEFTGNVIKMAAVDAFKAGRAVLLASLAVEVFVVESDRFDPVAERPLFRSRPLLGQPLMAACGGPVAHASERGGGDGHVCGVCGWPALAWPPLFDGSEGGADGVR